MSAPIIAFKKKKKPAGLLSMVLILGLVTLGLSFIPMPERKLKVEMTGSQWIQSDKWINIARNALSRSDLPAKDVSMINDSLTYFQQELYRQLNPQFKIEDSLNKITKPKN